MKTDNTGMFSPIYHHHPRYTMTQPDSTWKFYKDNTGQWQWRKYQINKVVAVSADSFTTRKKCIKDAATRGYVVPEKSVPETAICDEPA